MKILLVGDGYYLQNYCKYIYLLNKDVDFYIFCTNNTSLVGCNIVTEKDLLVIIKMIDRVYFLDDGSIPPQIIQKMESNLDKKAIIKHISLNEPETNYIPVPIFPNKPCVLILNDGYYNCCADLELQLIKCFYDKRIRISCTLCDELKNVIFAFRDVIQPQFLDYLDSQEVDLTIVSMDSKLVFDDYNIDVIKFIRNISPDFVIFCQEKINIDKQEKEKILQYRYGLSVDMIVYSEYITYNNEYGNRLQCKNIIIDNFNSVSCPMHQCIGEIITTEIINKLYIPPEIRRVVP